MKRIVIDPFDPKSVDRAVIQLLQFKTWLKERVDKLCEVLARDYALRTVADEFGYTEGGSVVCEAEEIRNGWVVRASGKAVFFLEYGTGTRANTGPKLGKPPVETTPGSFSENEAEGGKHKWSQWIEEHGTSDGFPWTIAPRAGMYYAFKAASENVQRVAEEVFKA